MRYFTYNIDDEFSHSVSVGLKGEKKYYVEGYASTTVKDKSGEIIANSAQEDIYKQIIGQNITMDLEHELWYDKDGNVLPKPKNDKIPIAKVVDAKKDDKGVWVKAELNQHLAKFQEIWGSIKDGFLKAFSIAFYPVEKVGDGVIKRLNLVNITLTGSPVNPEATFTASMKSASAYLNSLKQNLSLTDECAEAISIKCNTGETMKKELKDEKKEDSEEKEESKEKKPDDEEAEKKAEVEGKEKKEEEKTEESDKEKEKEDVEKKAKVKAEADLKAEIKILRDDIAKLKAELEKPVMKAMTSEVPKVESGFKIKRPLDLI